MTTTKTWGTHMADSIMERTPQLYTGKEYHTKWSYDYGVVLKGFLLLWKQTGEQKYFDFIKSNLDFFIGEDGSIKNYHKDEYNIDHINNGKLLFALYEETGEEKYKIAADQIRDQIRSHPRTSEGAFWHKKIYPYQIWLDGLYMGAPFYLEYLMKYEQGDNLDDVTKQFIICEQHTKDEATGLLYHAWDEKKVQPWCNPETGLSPNFWARSLGWYVMALVDVLELLPKEHADYEKLAAILSRTLTAVRNYQDAASGVWYQVINEGAKTGNYLEASASSMIVYAIAKGIRLGVLDISWHESLEKGFKGLIKEFIMETGKGWLNLTKNCQVAGLGGPDGRDGTFAYYISEPIVANDQKGLGAFLQACGEYEYISR